MLAANDNRYPANLQIAIWKMTRGGVPQRLIISTLGLTDVDGAKIKLSASEDK